jgi:hypothetical protein
MIVDRAETNSGISHDVAHRRFIDPVLGKLPGSRLRDRVSGNALWRINYAF